MKAIYSRLLQKISFLKQSTAGWKREIEGDFSFYNKHTELFAIWTVLYMTLAGLFFLAVRSKIFVMFLLLILSVAITFITTLFTVYYLHAIRYGNKKQVLHKTHKLFNKSFTLKTLLKFIKIPSFAPLSEIHSR